MRIRIVYNSWFANMIVGKNITLYPFIFMMADETTSRNNHILNHEWVHVEQIRKIGWLKFYSTYLWYYFKNLVKYRSFDTAYYKVPYEVEAYAEQDTFPLPEVLE